MDYDDLLKTNRACPFCSPARDSSIILENKNAYLTYALAPYHPDHILVVPKRHIVKILDVTREEENDLYELIRKALTALHKLDYKDISVLVRDGDDSMKTVDHMHYNFIPDTRLGDIDHLNVKRIILTPAEQAAEIERLKKIFK